MIASFVLSCLVSSSAWGAETAYGDFLNASFVGDGTTPSLLQTFDQAWRPSSVQALAGAGIDGRVRHSVALELPPAKMQPDLSLAYDSGSAGHPHSWVGEGWALQTGLVVQEVPGALVELRPEWITDMVLSVSGGGLSGHFLHVCDVAPGQGAACQDPAQWEWWWQSASPSAATLEPAGSAPLFDDEMDLLRIESGGKTWHVRRPETMGHPQAHDSRLWLPKRLGDRWGNYVEWEWSGTQLQRIDYGGLYPSTDHHVEVAFTYVEPTSMAVTRRARAGFLEVIDSRLAEIDVSLVDGGLSTLSRRYRLLPFPGEESTRARLAGVDVEGGSDGLVRLLERFTYREAPVAESYELVAFDEQGDAWQLPVNSNVSNTAPLERRNIPAWAGSEDEELVHQTVVTAAAYDATGDGIPDRLNVQRKAYGMEAVVTPAVGLGIDRIWDVGLTGVFGTQDYLDFPADEVQYLSRTVSVVLDRNSSNQYYGTSDPAERARSGTYATAMTIDVNGDGYLDYVHTMAMDPFGRNTGEGAFGSTGWDATQCAAGFPETTCSSPEAWNRRRSGTEWLVCYGEPMVAEQRCFGEPSVTPYLSAGETPNIGTWFNSDVVIGATDYDPIVTYEEGVSELVDMDGDGLLDVLYLDLNTSPQQLVWFRKLPGRGAGWDPTPRVSAYQPAEEGLRTVESHLVHDEVFYDWQTDYLAVENVRVGETRTLRGLHDLNGDGLVDLVVAVGAHHWDVHFGNGSGFEVTSVEWDTNGAPAYLSRAIEGRPRITFTGSGGGEFISPGAPPMLEGIGDWDTWYDTPVGAMGSSGGVGSLGICGVGEQGCDPSCHDCECEWFPGQGTCDDFGAQFPGLDQGSHEIELVDLGADAQELGLRPEGNSIGGVVAGEAGRVVAGLIDYDGDGLVDYFDGGAGLWFRNLGDGFDGGAPLDPDLPQCPGFVHCLTSTASTQHLEGDYTGWSPGAAALVEPSITMTQQQVWMTDMNGDRVPDVLVRDGWDPGSDTDGMYYRGVGGEPQLRMGLLESVETGRGLLTTFEYGHSAEVFPMGEYELDQTSPSHEAVLAYTSVYDPFDGGYAERWFTYSDRYCGFGRCQGFEAVAHADDVERPSWEAGQGTVTLSSLVVARTVLDGWHPRELSREVYEGGSYDPATDEVAGGQRRYRSDQTWSSEPRGNLSAWLEWPTDTVHTEQVGTSHRVLSTTISYDAFGNPTSQTHDGGTPGDVTDDVFTTISWVGDGEAFHRPCDLRRETDDGTGPVVVELVEMYYDGGATLCGGTLTNGAMTQQVAMAGPVDDLLADALTWVFTHDARGNVDSITHPHNAMDTYVFDDRGVGWVSHINPLSWLTTQAIDGWGRAAWSTDPNGASQRTTYDDLGRPQNTYAQGPDEPAERQLTKTTYAEADLSSAMPVAASQSTLHYRYDHTATPSGTYEEVTAYDGTGHALFTAVDDEAAGVRVSWSYDGVLGTSQATWTEQLTQPPVAMVTPSVAAAEALDRYTALNALGEETSRWSEETGEITTQRTGNPGFVVETEGELYRRNLYYDALGRLVEVAESNYGVPAVTTAEYTYDPLNRVTSFQEASGVLYRYRYDGAGRLRDVTRPTGLWVEYTYGDLGPLPLSMRHDGVEVVQWVYDDLGRSRFKYVDDLNGLSTYEWQWDLAWKGSLDATVDPWGTTLYTYEDHAVFGRRGLPSQVRRAWNLAGMPADTVFGHAYNGNGEVSSTLWPSGATVTTTRHGNGKVANQKVFHAGQTLSYDWSYDLWGQPAGWARETSLPGAVAASGSIVRNGPRQVGSAGVMVNGVGADLFYDYRGDGERTQRVVAVDGRLPDHELYAHDDLRRLVDGVIEFDDFGLPESVAGAPVEKSGNQMLSLYGSPVCYDSFGNLTCIDGATYQYDGAQHLRRATQQNVGTTDYGYDVDDQLVYEVTKWNGTTQSARRRFLGWHQRSDGLHEEVLPFLTLIDGVAHYVAKEPAGSSYATFELDGTVVADNAWNFWGGDEVGLGGTGHYLLNGLHGGVPSYGGELVHFGARHMRTKEGLWLQPEPLLYLGLTNGDLADPLGYGPLFARGNSNRYMDPDGDFAWPWQAMPAAPALMEALAASAAANPVSAGVVAGTLGAGATIYSNRVVHSWKNSEQGQAVAEGNKQRFGSFVRGVKALVTSAAATVEDVLEGATPLPKTRGVTKPYSKPGTYEDTNEDFDSLEPSDVRDIPGGGRVGTLPDGRKVISRPQSGKEGEGPPTLEIQDGKGRIKIRYQD